MPLSPSIPTSFVPRQPTDTGLRRQHSGANLFLVIASAVCGVAVLAAGATFAYQKYLESVTAADAAKLATAEANIDPSTVEGFVRLRDRLAAATGLLDNHIALSQFLTTLENATLSSVRFDELDLQVADDRSAKVVMTGSAKSFNTLAAQSAALADVPSIKRALFSDFDVDKSGSVTFGLSFDLDPKSILGNPAADIAAAQAKAAGDAAAAAATTTDAGTASTSPAVPIAPPATSPVGTSTPPPPPTP